METGTARYGPVRRVVWGPAAITSGYSIGPSFDRLHIGHDCSG
jgi:hypothetical protein